MDAVALGIGVISTGIWAPIGFEVGMQLGRGWDKLRGREPHNDYTLGLQTVEYVTT